MRVRLPLEPRAGRPVGSSAREIFAKRDITKWLETGSFIPVGSSSIECLRQPPAASIYGMRATIACLGLPQWARVSVEHRQALPAQKTPSVARANAQEGFR